MANGHVDYEARIFLKNTGMRLTVNRNENIGFDKPKVDSAIKTCHKKGHFTRECIAPRNQDYKKQESTRRNIPVETSTSTALVSCDSLGGYDWSDQAEEGPNYALMAYSSSKLSSDSEYFKKSKLMALAYKTGLESVEEKLEVYKANESIYSQDIKVLKFEIEFKGLGYNAVPPPYTGNFMPPTPDLSFTGLDEFVNKHVVENRKSDEEVSKVVRKSNDSLIIEDWVSDSEEEDVSQTKTEKKTVKPSIAKIEFVKPKQQKKTARKTVKQIEKHRQNTHSLRGNQRNWNNMMSQKLGSNFEMFNKACYVCGSFDHLQVDCNYHQKQFQNQRMVKPVWNNAQRVNHQNFARKTHPCAKKNIVPRAVLMKSGLVSINTARQNISKTAVSVNTARQVNTSHSKQQLMLDNPQMDLHDQGVIDSGCSRHITGNMSYLTDHEEIDGGYVAFGGNPKKEGKSQEKSDLVRKRIEKNGELKNRKRVEYIKNRQSDLVRKRIERNCELKNRKRVEYIKNRQSDLVRKRIERNVNAGDSKLMLLGINLILLVKVNAVRHNLLLLVKVNAARHNLLLLGYYC
ncbi:hypothetical protein Tco_0720779 [Tanacetum coccineum]